MEIRVYSSNRNKTLYPSPYRFSVDLKRPVPPCFTKIRIRDFHFLLTGVGKPPFEYVLLGIKRHCSSNVSYDCAQSWIGSHVVGGPMYDTQVSSYLCHGSDADNTSEGILDEFQTTTVLSSGTTQMLELELMAKLSSSPQTPPAVPVEDPFEWAAVIEFA